MTDADTTREAVEWLASDYEGPMPICAKNCGCSGVCRLRTPEACPCARTATLLRALAAERDAARAEAQRLREIIEAILDAFRCISPEAVIRAREAGEKTEIGNALEAAQDALDGRDDG